MSRSITAVAALVASLLCVPSAGAGDPWAKLRRPLRIPSIAPGSACPVTPARRISPDFAPAQGAGPVYPVIGSGGLLKFIYPPEPNQLWYPTQWGGQKVLWVGRSSYDGPVLIRGRQLDGPNELRFGDKHTPSGELQLTRSGASTGRWRGRQWPSYTRLRAPGCYAWQVDGTSFSRVIVFRAITVSG